MGAPGRDLVGQRQMGLEEFRFVDRLEERREARAEGYGQHGVGERGDGDEDGDAGVADEVVVAAELEQEGGGGEGRETLQDRGQREAFDRVVQAGLSDGGDGSHGTSP